MYSNRYDLMVSWPRGFTEEPANRVTVKSTNVQCTYANLYLNIFFFQNFHLLKLPKVTPKDSHDVIYS